MSNLTANERDLLVRVKQTLSGEISEAHQCFGDLDRVLTLDDRDDAHIATKAAATAAVTRLRARLVAMIAYIDSIKDTLPTT